MQGVDVPRPGLPRAFDVNFVIPLLVNDDDVCWGPFKTTLKRRAFPKAQLKNISDHAVGNLTSAPECLAVAFADIRRADCKDEKRERTIRHFPDISRSARAGLFSRAITRVGVRESNEQIRTSVFECARNIHADIFHARVCVTQSPSGY